jgi:hypothetical protein
MSRAKKPASPIPGIALDEVFPAEADFIHHISHVHGVAHASRVICHGIDMVNTHGPAEYLAPVWAAAFLHDLARRADGDCTEHGQWAVDDCWDLHVDRFRRAGVGPEWDERIQAAVINHCDNLNLDKHDPAWRLAAFLKDADAMDRYRIDESPDPRRLRLDHYEDVYLRAKKLEYLTDGFESGEEVWAVRQLMDERENEGVPSRYESLPSIPHLDAARLPMDAVGMAGRGKEAGR